MTALTGYPSTGPHPGLVDERPGEIAQEAWERRLAGVRRRLIDERTELERLMADHADLRAPDWLGDAHASVDDAITEIAYRGGDVR